jgi:archaemetzincin
LYIFACTNDPNGEPAVVTTKTKPPVSAEKAIVPITITVQPFDDLAEERVQYVITELKKVYPAIEQNKAIPLPDFAYYKPRHRYKADSLLVFLQQQTKNGHVTIGLTGKDISTTSDEYPDWGVMGLGLCPGNVCVASSFRLSKTGTSLQLFKVAIHELGHTQGLQHCGVKTCFMREGEGKNNTDEEKEFCLKCKKVLVSKGWKF